jgi:hypothetical protein
MNDKQFALNELLEKAEDISAYLSKMIQDRRITGELDKRRIDAFQNALARFKEKN